MSIHKDGLSKMPKKSIIFSMLGITLLPILLFGIIITFFVQHSVSEGMKLEVENFLSGIAKTELLMFQRDHQQGIEYKNGHYYSGNINVYNDNCLVDMTKEAANVDITFFYGDTRIQTSVIDSNGERIVGTKASDKIIEQVLIEGKEVFDESVLVGDIKYFGYYIPVISKNDEIVGMVFAGKPRDEVLSMVHLSSLKSIILCLLVLLSACVVCILFSKKEVMVLEKIMVYLGHISKGDFSQKIDSSVLKRKDEIGNIGKYSVRLADSLREMIMTDPLTSLLNRRSSILNIDRLTHNFKQEECFTIVIGDIDFFKTVNDRYGHECGDQVLSGIAEIFNEHIKSKGFAARWGGEEFLIVYENTGIQEAAIYLERLLDDIRSREFNYADEVFHITMTFGAKEYDGTLTSREVIKAADDNLYLGKNSGRNKIVAGE